MSCLSTKSCAFPYKETNSSATFAFGKRLHEILYACLHGI